MSSLRILLVDDHEIVRQGIRSVLAARPEWEVCGEAADGLEALALVEKLSPDIVVMDVSMPVMDGLEALARIRETHREIPVLFLTMHQSEELAAHALEAGARGVVSKVDAAAELVSAIEAVTRDETFTTAAASEILLDRYLLRTRRGGGSASSAGSHRELTERERDVVRLLSAGKSNDEIAAALGISPRTVESYRANAMRKVGARSASELVRYAIRNHLAEA